MASLSSDEQQPGQRRLSWSAMKSFVKNTKRRSVQRLVARGNEEQVTPEEQDFMDKKQKFKEFNQTVTKIRKHLVDMQSAITKLSTSITTLTDDEILLPAQGSEELQITKNRLDTLGLANASKGQNLIDLIEASAGSVKEKLAVLASIKKTVTERDNLKTDVGSYDRRLDKARTKNTEKNTAKTQADMEKLQGKLERARDNYTAKHEEALRQLDQLEKTRGTYLQDELHAIHKLAAEYFAALANGYSINAPKSKSAQMRENASNAFNAGKDKASKAAQDAKNKANNAVNTAKTAAAFGAMSMATSSASSANPFLKKSASNNSKNDNNNNVPPPKKQPSEGNKEQGLKVGSFVTATHDFVPEEDDELEFKKGTRLEVVEIIGPGWLMAKRKDGKSGMVPDTYVR